MNADMRDALFLAVLVVLGAWLVWNVLNVLRLLFGLRDGDWRRPMWWTRLCSVSLFVGLAAWVWGAFSGGLDVRETCHIRHNEGYDEQYREAHAEEFGRLFPLHDKCNADYDLVPAWVNLTVGTCVLVAAVAVGVLLWFAATGVIRRVRTDTPASR